jgi:hypothetical protein
MAEGHRHTDGSMHSPTDKKRAGLPARVSAKRDH